MSETYEQIVERRMNERGRGIQESIRLWGEGYGRKAIEGNETGRASQTEQDRQQADHEETGKTD